MRNISDPSGLLVRLRDGGQEELTRIFMSNRDAIRRLIANRLDPRLKARVDASDIVQEAFVRAGHALENYLRAPAVHPIVWLRLIGKRLVAETHREQFREKRSPRREQFQINDESRDQLARFLAAPLRSASSHIAAQDQIEQLRRIIDKMPELDRDILEMRHIDGMSIQEAANALEVSYETAKKRYQRALDRVRSLVVQKS